jgi:hypothetical protein
LVQFDGLAGNLGAHGDVLQLRDVVDAASSRIQVGRIGNPSYRVQERTDAYY